MLVSNEIHLDIAHPGILPRVYAVQGEAESRVILFSMRCNGTDWSPPEGSEVSVGFCRADGSGGVYGTKEDGSAAVTLQGSRLSVVLTREVCAAVGPVDLTVEISSGGAVLATWPVRVEVRANPAQESLDGVVLKGTWPPNKQLITDESGTVVAVDPEQRAVELDASGYAEGILRLTYADGESDLISVSFDSSGRPVNFVNGDEAFTVVWPAVEVTDNGA